MATFTIDEPLMLSDTKGFFSALADAAKQTQKDFGVFASVTLVQAALESAWGKSNVAKTNKNLFGIKYTGKYASGLIVEEKGCQCPASEQGGARYYNYYQSYGDSIYDHGWFLKNNSRYEKAGVFSAKDGKEQIKAIAAASYAEDPNYASSLIAMMDEYDLTKYDDLSNFTGASNNLDMSNFNNQPIDILPNVDHRPNIANMDQIKGACLIFNPPYNVCLLEEQEEHFAKWLWDKEYHYIIDPTYDIDANPDDDIPDLTNAKHIDEIDTDDGGDSENPEDEEQTEDEEQIEDEEQTEENLIQPRTPLGPDEDTNPKDPEDDDNEDDDLSVDDTSVSAAPEEDNSIVIKGGFLKDKTRLLQCYSLTDNDKVTYISRTLFNSKPTAHCLMIGCFIPDPIVLMDKGIDYEKVEKNIINSVSKILWANGLTAKDLWREFDLNRIASPAHYLERDKWTKLLEEIDKQIEWRNAKFGSVSAQYEKYIAVIPDQTIHLNSGGNIPGSTLGISGTMSSDNEVANTCYAALTRLGCTPECACAIIGNMEQESSLRPTVVNHIGASGLCQWLDTRLTGLKNYASSKGKEWTDIETQCEWAIEEIKGKDPTTKSFLQSKEGLTPEEFMKLTDLPRAVDAWRKCFERCGEHEANDAKRLKYAQHWYSQIAQTATSYAIQPRRPLGPDEDASPDDEDIPNDNPTPNGSFSEEDFKNAVFVGDSLTVGLKRNNEGIKACCTGGQTVGKGKVEHFDNIVKQNPRIIVISYGTNDSAYKDVSGFITNFKNFINDLKKSLPNVSIFVNKIFPGDKSKANSDGKEIIKNIPAHNEAIDQIAKDTGTSVLDCTTIPNLQTYYEPDGLHFKGEFYKLWYTKMKELIMNSSSSESPLQSGTTGTTGALINSIWGEIKNPGLAATLPYNGNSMGGLEHKEWGGKMKYYINDPLDEDIEKPTIENVMTYEEYEAFCNKFFLGERYDEDGIITEAYNFQNYWELIDLYAEGHEPYNKGLINAENAGISPNDRLNALTTTFTTGNENVFYFNVLESGPGSADSCVKAADELNYVIVPKDLKVEPIYPDLILPPQYTTTDNDQSTNNAIPFSVIKQTQSKEAFTKQLSFDYDLLKDKIKKTDESLGPINFMDPYPTDDKITELERHEPKVFVDEIEAQIYSCNHPGCPIGQPMAKNFAMLSDALISQSKKTEQRLVKLENILSTIMRNQARLSSRININCVYYGGQSTLAGKYKCIRCMHDDRVHDGAIVTLDQCLNCTRYEPILGQIYQILDESGFNGSVVLDDMQMSYSDLNNYKQLNMQTERSPKYGYVEVNGENNCVKPEKDRIELWKEANKQIYLKEKEAEALEQEVKDDMTSEEVKEEVEEAKEAEYIFRMNWATSFLNSQQPDVKAYPTEGIIMRYKKETGDLSYSEYLKTLDPELDKDVIEDIQKEMKLVDGQWVSTQEIADSVQINKYSSENFYFEGFAEMKQCFWNGSGSSGGVAECRKKILEMAEIIVKECTDGLAWYSQANRTVDYNKPGYANGKKAYDCTSFASCCYLNAGLKSMYNKTCSGGTLVNEIINNGGEMWLMNEEGFSKAKPGDVLLVATSKVSESQMGQFIKTEHAIIYMGDKTIAHAANSRKGIVKEPIEDWRMRAGTHFFVRPKDLIDADVAASASIGSNGGVTEESGTVDDKNYVARIPSAVCTTYQGSGKGASGLGCEYNKTCASHNMPYGTKIYIPQLKDKLGGDGVLTVTDTGGCFFDFDLYTTSNIGKTNADVYVLEWGTGKVTPSYTWAINFYLENGRWKGLVPAWNTYKNMGGKLITFTKYNQEDANITNHPNYNDK